MLFDEDPETKLHSKLARIEVLSPDGQWRLQDTALADSYQVNKKLLDVARRNPYARVRAVRDGVVIDQLMATKTRERPDYQLGRAPK
jgi:hypothetical protein